MNPNNADAKHEFFRFPQGLAGFGDATRFSFTCKGKSDIIALQGIDHPEKTLLLTPWDRGRLGPPPKLSPEQEQALHLKHDYEPMWMLVLNPFADPQWVTANLMAPVALNPSEDLGLQDILPDPGLPLRFHWMRQPN